MFSVKSFIATLFLASTVHAKPDGFQKLAVGFNYPNYDIALYPMGSGAGCRAKCLANPDCAGVQVSYPMYPGMVNYCWLKSAAGVTLANKEPSTDKAIWLKKGVIVQ